MKRQRRYPTTNTLCNLYASRHLAAFTRFVIFPELLSGFAMGILLDFSGNWHAPKTAGSFRAEFREIATACTRLCTLVRLRDLPIPSKIAGNAVKRNMLAGKSR